MGQRLSSLPVELSAQQAYCALESSLRRSGVCFTEEKKETLFMFMHAYMCGCVKVCACVCVFIDLWVTWTKCFTYKDP